jgi:hypothetical protein
VRCAAHERADLDGAFEWITDGEAWDRVGDRVDHLAIAGSGDQNASARMTRLTGVRQRHPRQVRQIGLDVDVVGEDRCRLAAQLEGDGAQQPAVGLRDCPACRGSNR